MPNIKEITLTIAWILLGTGLSNTTGNSLDPAPGRSPGPPPFNVFAETKKTTPTFVDDQFSDINYSHEVEADRRTSTLLTTIEPPVAAQQQQQQVNFYYTTTSETMTGNTATATTKEKFAVGDTPIVTLQQHTISSSTSSSSSLHHHHPYETKPSPCKKYGSGNTQQQENDSEFIRADDKIVRISNDDVDDAVQFDVMHDVFDTTPTTTNLVAGIVYKGKFFLVYL